METISNPTNKERSLSAIESQTQTSTTKPEWSWNSTVSTGIRSAILRWSEKLSTVNESYELFTLLDHEKRKWLVEKAIELCDKISTENWEHLVFLDRSARPLVTLLKAVWPFQAYNKPFPSVSFMNIGREKLEDPENPQPAYSGFEGEFLSNILGQYVPGTKVEAEEMDDLSDEDLFKIIAPDRNEYTAEIHQQYCLPKQDASVFKNKRVLIIDDFCSTGGTGKLADRIFKSAFGADTTEWEVAYFDEDANHGGMPWSHGAHHNSPTWGLGGVVEPEDSTSIMAEPTIKQQPAAITESRLILKQELVSFYSSQAWRMEYIVKFRSEVQALQASQIELEKCDPELGQNLGDLNALSLDLAAEMENFASMNAAEISLEDGDEPELFMRRFEIIQNKVSELDDLLEAREISYRAVTDNNGRRHAPKTVPATLARPLIKMLRSTFMDNGSTLPNLNGHFLVDRIVAQVDHGVNITSHIKQLREELKMTVWEHYLGKINILKDTTWQYAQYSSWETQMINSFPAIEGLKERNGDSRVLIEKIVTPATFTGFRPEQPEQDGPEFEPKPLQLFEVALKSVNGKRIWSENELNKNLYSRESDWLKESSEEEKVEVLCYLLSITGESSYFYQDPVSIITSALNREQPHAEVVTAMLQAGRYPELKNYLRSKNIIPIEIARQLLESLPTAWLLKNEEYGGYFFIPPLLHVQEQYRTEIFLTAINRLLPTDQEYSNNRYFCHALFKAIQREGWQLDISYEEQIELAKMFNTHYYTHFGLSLLHLLSPENIKELLSSWSLDELLSDLTLFPELSVEAKRELLDGAFKQVVSMPRLEKYYSSILESTGWTEDEFSWQLIEAGHIDTVAYHIMKPESQPCAKIVRALYREEYFEQILRLRAEALPDGLTHRKIILKIAELNKPFSWIPRQDGVYKHWSFDWAELANSLIEMKRGNMVIDLLPNMHHVLPFKVAQQIFEQQKGNYNLFSWFEKYSEAFLPEDQIGLKKWIKRRKR